MDLIEAVTHTSSAMTQNTAISDLIKSISLGINDTVRIEVTGNDNIFVSQVNIEPVEVNDLFICVQMKFDDRAPYEVNI